ncbi:hypothetical protein [Olivibacter jilunii]|uniref:hypothetical protein n=1 Tax=Olivibacter jilunii TaxID=985016 RepID=UPI003F14AE6C
MRIVNFIEKCVCSETHFENSIKFGDAKYKACLQLSEAESVKRLAAEQEIEYMSNILKKILISLGLACTLILLAITFITNFLFKPEKITPIALKAINQQLDGQVFCKSVELTFFSSFPRFGARLHDGYILSKDRRDTLVIFSDFRGAVNMTKLLLKKEIDVERITLRRPRLHLAVDQHGNANYDILKKETAEATDTSDVQSAIKKFILNRFASKMPVFTMKTKDQDLIAESRIWLLKLGLFTTRITSC